VNDTIIKKCANCGKELLGAVYRVDKGSFGDRPIAHFLEDFKFDKRIGYFCLSCLAGVLISLLEG